MVGMSDCSTNAWRSFEHIDMAENVHMCPKGRESLGFDQKIPPKPGACPYEGSVLDGKKSYCSLWERWTNCREAGRCVLESIEGKDR